jgi:hypothetical protein
MKEHGEVVRITAAHPVKGKPAGEKASCAASMVQYKIKDDV